MTRTRQESGKGRTSTDSTANDQNTGFVHSIPSDDHGVNPADQVAEASTYLRALMRFGEVHEIRTPGFRNGFYNDPDLAAMAALQLDADNSERTQPVAGTYVTLNSIDPAVAAGALNGAPRSNGRGGGAKNADVLRLRHLLIDVDPERHYTPEEAALPKNERPQSATDAERDAALAVRDRIRSWLTEQGWPEPVAVTMSGNGGALIYRLRLEGDATSGGKLLKAALLALAAEFDEENIARVDTGVDDLVRLTKVPGTVSRKGPHTAERPWRMATAEVNEDAGDVTTDQLRALAGERVADRLDWQEERTTKGGIHLHLSQCPTGDHEKSSLTDTTIIVFPDGRRGFKCQHNTCNTPKKRTWQDVKAALGMDSTESDAKPSAATMLYELVIGQGVELFHDDLGEAWAMVPVNGHREAHAIDSKGFRQWLGWCFHRANGKPAGAQAIADVVALLSSYAVMEHEQREVFVRVGNRGETVYLDLCNDRWEAVEINAEGWRVIIDPPIAFHRTSGMLPLPTPVRGGDIEALRLFINDGGENDNFVLSVAWVVGAMLPGGPYPVLLATGEPGAAKSSLVDVLRKLIDPNVSNLRRPPKDDETLLIQALNSRVLTIDNLSSIPRWLSDAICRMATGGGIGKRSLYTNFDEVIANVKRPVALTGVGEIGQESDLLDRSLILRLPALSRSGKKVLTEKVLGREWEKVHPHLLGVILDAVSAAIRNRPSVGELDLPRMADFAEWMVAAETGLGWTPGTFLSAYRRNRGLAQDQALESSPIYRPLLKLLREKLPDRTAWNVEEPVLTMGSAALYEALTDRVPQPHRSGAKSAWPGSASVMTQRLEMVSSNLADAGIRIRYTKRSDVRGYEIRVTEEYWTRREAGLDEVPAPSGEALFQPQTSLVGRAGVQA